MSELPVLNPSASPDRSFKLRILLFLYGNANIAGCGLALLGPALLFLGIIGPGWLWITAGCYSAGCAAGWAMRKTPDIARQLEDSLSKEQILDHLDTLLVQVRPHLSADMYAHLVSVKNSVQEVLPRLVGAVDHDADWFTVKETVFRYLPETLANYVALPSVFRTTKPLAEGKTARQLLAEQLELLDEKMLSIVSDVASADAQALLANGRFLEMKFRQPDFLAR